MPVIGGAPASKGYCNQNHFDPIAYARAVKAFDEELNGIFSNEDRVRYYREVNKELRNYLEDNCKKSQKDAHFYLLNLLKENDFSFFKSSPEQVINSVIDSLEKIFYKGFSIFGTIEEYDYNGACEVIRAVADCKSATEGNLTYLVEKHDRNNEVLRDEEGFKIASNKLMSEKTSFYVLCKLVEKQENVQSKYLWRISEMYYRGRKQENTKDSYKKAICPIASTIINCASIDYFIKSALIEDLEQNSKMKIFKKSASLRNLFWSNKKKRESVRMNSKENIENDAMPNPNIAPGIIRNK